MTRPAWVSTMAQHADRVLGDVLSSRGPVRPDPAPEDHLRAIERLLFREARLLDERRWDDWLALWTPDAGYAIPTRDTPEPSASFRRPVGDELTPAGGTWWVDDRAEHLGVRVAKLKTGKAWAEDPPSRTRRFVTNVEILGHGSDGLFDVTSNLLLYRTRRESDQELISACRKDRIRRLAANGYLIEQRFVILDAKVLHAANFIAFL